MKYNFTIFFIIIFIILSFSFLGCHNDAFNSTGAETLEEDTGTGVIGQGTGKNTGTKFSPGEILYTYISSNENGNIAVRIDLPKEPRYGKSAPIVVVASTWFVEKYSKEEVEFHLVYNPVDIGAVSVSHLWPGKTDPESGIESEGSYDFGGPKSLAALRDTIRFALGLKPNIEGKYLHELISIDISYDNVGMFASSHAGVVATNVMAYFGQDLEGLSYFVGRENPTLAEMYPLEIGHFGLQHNPVYNPYYNPENYKPTSIDVDYSNLGWIKNQAFPEGRPIFFIENGNDYVLDNKGPKINGKRLFSYPLTKALADNGALSLNNWPEDVARPEMVKNFWPYRITVNNYGKIGQNLPDLKILLSFATYDHVQPAPDKPHIRQAYDGFQKTASLWVRLNCDLSYVKSEISSNASLESGFPDNEANSEPDDWLAEAESWGFEGILDGNMTARTVPLAAIAEMADRTRFNNWDENLEGNLIK